MMTKRKAPLRNPRRSQEEIRRAERRGLPGTYAQGGGLYRKIDPQGRTRWVFRWRDRLPPVNAETATGKKAQHVLREKSIGPESRVSRRDAVRIARQYATEVAEGRDPIEEEHERKAAAAIKRARSVTFGRCCDEYIAAHRAGWRNAKHAQQWHNTLHQYCADLLDLPVSAVDTGLVMHCIEPEWSAKNETMSRVRSRIENVLDYAITREYRPGPNPAVWRGHLDKLLPPPSKVQRVEHHRALPYAEIGDFMTELRAVPTMAAKAMEFQILTCVRPGEACGVQWPEIDLQRATWTIPGDRMKAGKEHRVPLSGRAVAILAALPHGTDENVFFGQRLHTHIGIAATAKLLRELRPEVHQHGFRSTFRDWCGEQTAYAHDVVEMALAHRVGTATEVAYRRTDLFDKRRKLMEAWAQFCATPSAKGNVIPMQRERA